MTKTSNSEIAYQKLKDQILENELAAGYQATEEDVARQLGMSRTPTHEALVRLQNEGLVEIRPRHGMRVLPVSIDDMREIYEILTSLESLAAGEIARKGLPEADLQALSNAVSDMDTALEADDLVAWAAADKRFHGLLVSCHGNIRVQSLVNNFMDQSHRCRMLTLKLRPRPDKSNADHAAVLDAIRRGDADAARKIHHQHREKSAALLIELLENLGLKQL
jgi:DNA-binding GntR family transcriptional regulator